MVREVGNLFNENVVGRRTCLDFCAAKVYLLDIESLSNAYLQPGKTMKTPYKRVLINLPEELLAEVDRAAKHEHRKRNEFVREARPRALIAALLRRR